MYLRLHVLENVDSFIKACDLILMNGMLLNSIDCCKFMMFIALVIVSAAVCRGFGWHVLGDLDVTHACFVFGFQVQGRGTVQPGACLGAT